VKNNHNWSKSACFIITAIILALTCPAGCVYIPIIRSSGERGIAEDMLSGIVVGKTTDEDILLTFGCPSYDSESADGSTFVYYWKITRGYAGFFFAVGGAGAGGVSSPTSYRTLRISFDFTGTVRSSNLEKKFKAEKILGVGTLD
jgi:outer membrane protein assembly factor BamE (lipoprotein component of BamABCDE complex)